MEQYKMEIVLGKEVFDVHIKAYEWSKQRQIWRDMDHNIIENVWKWLYHALSYCPHK
jgi:hypothetical protein